MAIPAMAQPIPIPAIAPVESPFCVWTASEVGELVTCDVAAICGTAVVCDASFLVAGLVVVIAPELVVCTVEKVDVDVEEDAAAVIKAPTENVLLIDAGAGAAKNSFRGSLQVTSPSASTPQQAQRPSVELYTASCRAWSSG